jgi:hypothetical protein
LPLNPKTANDSPPTSLVDRKQGARHAVSRCRIPPRGRTVPAGHGAVACAEVVVQRGTRPRLLRQYGPSTTRDPSVDISRFDAECGSRRMRGAMQVDVNRLRGDWATGNGCYWATGATLSQLANPVTSS